MPPPKPPFPSPLPHTQELDEDLFLFLGSPVMLNLDDLEERDVFLPDLPKHDMTSDFVLLAEQISIERAESEQWQAK